MPKFPPNTGFKMPGIGSKEVNSPSNFRDDHHVDKMGYCDTTPDNMLPSGSSPLKYTPISDDDPYTSVRYTPGSLDASDAFEGKKPAAQDKEPVKQELDNIAKDGDGSKANINYNTTREVKALDTKVPDLVNLGKKGSGKNQQGQILTDTKQGRGKSMRQAYDDALKLGFRKESESFEDYSVRAKKHKDYGKGGEKTTTKTFIGPDGKKISEEEYKKIFK